MTKNIERHMLILELRKEILEIALNIENMISELLILYLNIEKEERKAISNKNSCLTFKNKIDLLFDLDVLTKTEHGNLLLLMEFRNQFLHNYQCNSFTKAVQFLGEDKSRKLLAFNDLNEGLQDSEFNHINAFRTLHISCMDIVLLKIKAKDDHSKERRKIVLDLADYTKLIIDKDTEMLAEIQVLCNSETDFLDIKSLKSSIVELIYKRIDDMNNLQEIKNYQDDILNYLSSKVKKYFN